MRDQAWLERLLKNIWADHFHDIKRTAPLQIRYGKRARNRLGSLSYDSKSKQSIIRLTRLFEDPDIPDLVVKSTIVHELCHYAHGFNAASTPRYRHPHAGGVIRREFAERGLEELYSAQKRWLKSHWPAVVRKHFPKAVGRRRRTFRVRYRII